MQNIKSTTLVTSVNVKPVTKVPEFLFVSRANSEPALPRGKNLLGANRILGRQRNHARFGQVRSGFRDLGPICPDLPRIARSRSRTVPNLAGRVRSSKKPGFYTMAWSGNLLFYYHFIDTFGILYVRDRMNIQIEPNLIFFRTNI